MLSLSLLSAFLVAGSLNPDAPRRQPIEPEPRGADPLRRACRVCGAATGVACDPERLGKAGRRGATAHRDR